MIPASNSTHKRHKLQALAQSYIHVATQPSIEKLFASEPSRLQNMQCVFEDVLLDISRQNITTDIWQTLCGFAEDCKLLTQLRAWMKGEVVNSSENRATLHQLYRQTTPAVAIDTHTQSIWNACTKEIDRMRQCAVDFQQGRIMGSDGKALTTIINVGIGGSHLGMEAMLHALHPWRVQHIECKFLANIDPHALEVILQQVDLRRCAVVFSSKSATTIETRSNFSRLVEAMKASGIVNPLLQCFAVTAKPDDVYTLGIDHERTFTIPESVGGRYSLWSPMGFVLHCCITPSAMCEFFAGAEAIDKHTVCAPIAHNIPVMLALISYWRHSLCGVQQHAVLAYSHALRTVVQHLQQLVMESNGKRITQHGTLAPTSGEVIWGGENSNGQHSYFQLLHQGNIPHNCDVWMFAKPHGVSTQAHRELHAMALGQMQALSMGNSDQRVERITAGKIPLSVLLFQQYTARNIGTLLALYENRTIAHAFLLGINPFDQWGVEFGKQHADALVNVLDGTQSPVTLDPSTADLVDRII